LVILGVFFYACLVVVFNLFNLFMFLGRLQALVHKACSVLLWCI